MGDFIARHSALGDLAGIITHNRTQLQNQINQLIHWDFAVASYTRGGTLDHILTSGFVTFQVRCSAIPVFSSDHIALSVHYNLPTTPSPVHNRICIAVPPKYYSTYISYMTNLLPSFDVERRLVRSYIPLSSILHIPSTPNKSGNCTSLAKYLLMLEGATLWRFLCIYIFSTFGFIAWPVCHKFSVTNYVLHYVWRFLSIINWLNSKILSINK